MIGKVASRCQSCILQYHEGVLYLLLPGIEIQSKSSLAEKKQYQYLAYAAAYWPLHFVSQVTGGY